MNNNEQESIAQFPSKRAIPPFIVKAAAIASLGGILFGYDMGVIAGALPQLVQHFSLNQRQEELIVGLVYFGAGVGACVGGSICDLWGRKTGILLTDIIFILGAVLLFWADSVQLIYVGRFIVGFAVSISGIADVAYLHEMSPVQWRGSLVSVNEGCISLGFLSAFLAGFVLRDHSDGWRYMFGLSGILAFVQFVGMCTMPESPVWLHQQGRFEDHQAALYKIRGHGRDHQMPSDQQPIAEPKPRIDTPSLGRDVLNPILDAPSSAISFLPPLERHGTIFQTIARYRKQICVALFLAIFQQLSGQTVVLNFALRIFSSLDDNNSNDVVMVYIGLVKFAVTLLVIWRIEYVGRRFLLLTGMTILAIGQFLVGTAFRQGPWALPGVLCVVMGYSLSFGPLTWLITSEIFPTNIRGRTLGTVTVVTYLTATLVTSTFLSMQDLLGPSTVFLFYGTMTAVGVLFVYIAIPETSGRSVQEIDAAFQDMVWWKRRTTLDTRLSPTPSTPNINAGDFL